MEITADNILWMCLGVLVVMTVGGWSFYMWHLGSLQAPIREVERNVTIYKEVAIPTEVTIDTSSLDLVRITTDKGTQLVNA